MSEELDENFYKSSIEILLKREPKNLKRMYKEMQGDLYHYMTQYDEAIKHISDIQAQMEVIDKQYKKIEEFKQEKIKKYNRETCEKLMWHAKKRKKKIKLFLTDETVQQYLFEKYHILLNLK